MKLKLAAAAALVALSGAANAAISNGADGNGELFFSVWDANSSYSRDLNITLDSFEAGVAAAGSYLKTVSADSLFTSFLATVDLSTAMWAISATDTQGARRMVETYSVLPTISKTNGDIRTAATATQNIISALNPLLGAADSVVVAAGVTGYAGNNDQYGLNSKGLLGFDRVGTAANNSYDSGLGLLRIDALATGLLPAKYTPYADNGSALRAFLDLNQGSATFGQLTIAAPVPEPESYAMLLAGLGVMGAIARRRRNKQA